MSAVTERDFRRILGVRFYVGPIEGLLELALRGGLFVVPAAPALAELDRDVDYRDSLERSDVALTDSGFMVLLWLLRKRERVTRISGLRLLRALIEMPEFRATGQTFWIMPSEEDSATNIAWLKSAGLAVGVESTYVAPRYERGAMVDPELLAIISRRKPRFIVINLGGGVQEQLGVYLRDALDYRPSIFCTGAAIAFLSGRQAGIPPWADRAMLGWLARCLDQPRRFIPRYLRALRFTRLFLRFGSEPVRVTGKT